MASEQMAPQSSGMTIVCPKCAAIQEYADEEGEIASTRCSTPDCNEELSPLIDILKLRRLVAEMEARLREHAEP